MVSSIPKVIYKVLYMYAKQNKYQIPEMNVVKPEKPENIKEKSNQPVK